MKRPDNAGQEPSVQQTDERERKNKSLEEWHDLVMERIQEAIARGDFDNLPGAGKPLNLDENPNEPAELRMAHRLLKNNDLAPAWILERRALLIEIETLRVEMVMKWEYYAREYDEERDETLRQTLADQWDAQVRDWEEQVRDLNRRILDLNLTLPIWRMELLRFQLDRELQRLGVQRRLGVRIE